MLRLWDLRRLNKYFQRELELLLTPIRLDPAHPFPVIPYNIKSLSQPLRVPNMPRRAVVNMPAASQRPEQQLLRVLEVCSAVS